MNRLPMNTSYSGHGKCFLCRRKEKYQKTISEQSIATAFIEHSIYIPKGTRSCYRHLNEGNIKDSEYSKIPVHVEHFERKMLNSLGSSFKKILDCLKKEEIMNENPPPHPPLENFRSFSTLFDEFCLEFIGWSKETFILFSSFFNKNKIRDTQNRSKGMLIALYIYWLKSGMAQKSLAYFKNKSSQQKISNELMQIRTHINRDFTPRYIGFASVTRNFLLNQVTDTVKVLYGIKADQLVLILDGGYQRHEKSFNNEFQSCTFSGQKKQNLLKPFIVTTPSGYIVECYVDMDATWNDDRILREVLAKDVHFRKMLRPNDYFFLDR
jgi:hypothetical protein